MKKLLSASLVLAMAFILSCSSNDDDGSSSSIPTVFNCSLNGETVSIGGRLWMAENLNCNVSGSKCYKDEPANCAKYGRLYNWETAMKVCPGGWHLPSDDEWDALITAVGGKETAGTKLKASNGWDDDNGRSGNGTDNYGFSALPGGDGTSDPGGYFSNVGIYGYWWSASEHDSGNAYFLGMYNFQPNTGWDWFGKGVLCSVRCVQD